MSNLSGNTKGDSSHPNDEAMELSSFCSKGYEADLQCPICEKIYNFSYRAPLTLPCGHDVCSKEVENFKTKKTFKCPTCNANHPSSCQFKMNLPILQVIHSLFDTVFCSKHKDKIVELCLYERKLLCVKCLKEDDHASHKKDSLKVFLEKMRETRKWRKDIEERIQVENSEIIDLIDQREKELRENLRKIGVTVSEKNRYLYENVNEEMVEYFKILRGQVTFNQQIQKCKFALPNKFVELDLIKDLEYGVYQLELDDLKTELEKWSFKVRKQEILKGFEEKLQLLKIIKGDSETSIAFEYKKDQFKFEFDKFVRGEYDLLTAIIGGVTGMMYLKKRKNENSLEVFKKSRAVLKAYFGRAHPLIGRCYYGIGASYGIIGQTEKTVKYQEKAIEIFRRINENYPEIGDCYHSLAASYRGQANYEESLKYLWKALEIKKFNYGENHSSLVVIYNAIGNIFRVQGKYKEAFDLHKRALEIATENFGPHHPLVADSYDDMGVTQTYLLNTELALDYLLKALELRKKNFGDLHPSVANSYNNLGLVYKIENNLHEAIETYKHSLKIRLCTLGDNNPSTATVYNNMGVIYRNLNNFSESIICHEKALELRIKIFGYDHLEVAKTLNGLGKVYFANGNKDKAKEVFTKAYEISKKITGESHPETQKYLKSLTKLTARPENEST